MATFVGRKDGRTKRCQRPDTGTASVRPRSHLREEPAHPKTHPGPARLRSTAREPAANSRADPGGEVPAESFVYESPLQASRAGKSASGLFGRTAGAAADGLPLKRHRRVIEPLSSDEARLKPRAAVFRCPCVRPTKPESDEFRRQRVSLPDSQSRVQQGQASETRCEGCWRAGPAGGHRLRRAMRERLANGLNWYELLPILVTGGC